MLSWADWTDGASHLNTEPSIAIGISNQVLILCFWSDVGLGPKRSVSKSLLRPWNSLEDPRPVIFLSA